MRYHLRCVSDLHGVMPDDDAAMGTSAWLVAGDVANNGDGKAFTLWARKQNIPIVAVKGEHESGVFGSVLFGHYCMDVSGTATRLGKGLLVAGIGFCGSMNADVHHLPTERAIAEASFAMARAVRRRRRKTDAVVLVTHFPPDVPEWVRMSGAPSHLFYFWVRHAIEQLRPVVMVCGHVHGLFGRSMRWKHRNGSTLLVCPGPQGATLAIDAARQTARVQGPGAWGRKRKLVPCPKETEAGGP